jgi:hypothetical protein
MNARNLFGIAFVAFALVAGVVPSARALVPPVATPVITAGGSFVDYVDPQIFPAQMPQNPGVKIGVDRFFADKPESVSVLYAAEYGHVTCLNSSASTERF